MLKQLSIYNTDYLNEYLLYIPWTRRWLAQIDIYITLVFCYKFTGIWLITDIGKQSINYTCHAKV